MQASDPQAQSSNLGKSLNLLVRLMKPSAGLQ